MKKFLIISLSVLFIIQICLLVIDFNNYIDFAKTLKGAPSIFTNEGLWVYLKPFLYVLERLFFILAEVGILWFLFFKKGKQAITERN